MVVAKALLEMLWELRGTSMAATLLQNGLGSNLLLHCFSSALLCKEAFLGGGYCTIATPLLSWKGLRQPTL